MKISMKKRTVKIIISLILIIVILALGAIIARVVINENQIKQTEEKLSKINSKELETFLIEELKSTSLNVNTSSIKTIFGTGERFASEFNGVSALDFALSLHYKEENPFEDYISAYIVTNNGENGIVIPCFKIISDNNGNFKYILYLTNSKFNVSDVVNKVFKTKYNINILLTGNNKYYDRFIAEGNKKYQEKMQIYLGITEEENAINIAKEIEPKLNNASDEQALNWFLRDKEVTLAFFGIDK